MRVIAIVLLSFVRLFAQDAKVIGAVAPNLAEFIIPLEQPASATWNWNRAETPDNGGEYIWQVSVPNSSGRYSFGFYLYKFPGSKPARGSLQGLLKAGQASVFMEDDQGHSDLVQNAKLSVSAEDDRIVLRIRDAEWIRTIFGKRPETATINTRAIGANFEVVKIQYQK
ncbi:MAG: hypothetical protein U0Q18_34400 [Bryobacteraceae bacterium]